MSWANEFKQFLEPEKGKRMNSFLSFQKKDGLTSILIVNLHSLELEEQVYIVLSHDIGMIYYRSNCQINKIILYCAHVDCLFLWTTN